MTGSSSDVRLDVRGLTAGYNGTPAVRDVDLTVRAGEIVLLGGRNGAGKSTTIMAISGLVDTYGGHIEINGVAGIKGLHRKARHGLGLIMESRGIFPQLSVADNLRLGAGSVEKALGFFPELESRLNVKAGRLSGGEQQMLVLSRILAADAKLILADELSLGLAPIVVQRIFAVLTEAAANGCGVLLVEQHVEVAMRSCQRCYFIKDGRIALQGEVSEVRKEREALESIYL